MNGREILALLVVPAEAGVAWLPLWPLDDSLSVELPRRLPNWSPLRLGDFPDSSGTSSNDFLEALDVPRAELGADEALIGGLKVAALVDELKFPDSGKGGGTTEGGSVVANLSAIGSWSAGRTGTGGITELSCTCGLASAFALEVKRKKERDFFGFNEPSSVS